MNVAGKASQVCNESQPISLATERGHSEGSQSSRPHFGAKFLDGSMTKIL